MHDDDGTPQHGDDGDESARDGGDGGSARDGGEGGSARDEALRAGRAELAAVDELTREFAALQAELSALHAREIELYARAMRVAVAQTARVGARDTAHRDLPIRWIAAELALVARMSDRAVQGRMGDALALTDEFPDTVAALAAGRISRAHAQTVLDAGAAIVDAGARARLERELLEFAAHESVGRTRAFARQLSAKHDPRPPQERCRAAEATRRVWVTDLSDGVAELHALLPAALAHGILDRLTQQGTAVRRADGVARRAAAAAEARAQADTEADAGAPADADAGTSADDDDAEPDAAREDSPFDDRTLDQVRADLLADLMLTGAPAIDPIRDTSAGGLGAIRATVQLTMPVTTLTGVTDGGAELDGLAPIDPDTARRLAADVPSWVRVMCHPVTGTVLAVDRYARSAEQKRLLVARDQHCRFPGCRMPARRCEHDHTVDYAGGGKTEVCNLACLCRRHHTLKHHTDWSVRQGAGGVLEWTSPTRRRYLDRPPARVMFAPDDRDPPPF